MIIRVKTRKIMSPVAYSLAFVFAIAMVHNAYTSATKTLPDNTIDCKNFHKLMNGNWQSNTVEFVVDTNHFYMPTSPIRPQEFLVDGYDVWRVINQKCSR